MSEFKDVFNLLVTNLQSEVGMNLASNMTILFVPANSIKLKIKNNMTAEVFRSCNDSVNFSK